METNLPANAGGERGRVVQGRGLIPESGRFPGVEVATPTLVFFPERKSWTEESGGLQSWGHEESQTQLSEWANTTHS